MNLGECSGGVILETLKPLLDHEYSIEQIKAENEKLKDELNMAERAFYEKREADAYRAGYEDGKRDSVKHGHWIRLNQMSFFTYDEFYQCSECRLETTNTTDYCPNCGAIMDGKEQTDGET